MRRLLKPVWILLAVLFLIEAWLWDHLEPIVARFVRLIPWQRLKALLARSISRLSPTATLGRRVANSRATRAITSAFRSTCAAIVSGA